jgi:hypothetical protein
MRKQANTCLRFFLPIHELARDRGPPSGKRGDALTRCKNAHVKIPLSANKTILRNPGTANREKRRVAATSPPTSW